MTPVYRLNGEHFGYFLPEGHLLRLDGAYVAWRDRTGLVFSAQSRACLGQVQGEFIVRAAGQVLPGAAQVAPPPPVGKRHFVRQTAKQTIGFAVGATDALQSL
jgi:hypothetical protein